MSGVLLFTQMCYMISALIPQQPPRYMLKLRSNKTYTGMSKVTDSLKGLHGAVDFRMDDASTPAPTPVPELHPCTPGCCMPHEGHEDDPPEDPKTCPSHC